MDTQGTKLYCSNIQLRTASVTVRSLTWNKEARSVPSSVLHIAGPFTAPPHRDWTGAIRCWHLSDLSRCQIRDAGRSERPRDISDVWTNEQRPPPAPRALVGGYHTEALARRWTFRPADDMSRDHRASHLTQDSLRDALRHAQNPDPPVWPELGMQHSN